jgi:phenylalanyl-tRNA synthetase alpha chain
MHTNDSLQTQMAQLVERARIEFEAAPNEDLLNQIKAAFLGKQGPLTALMAQMRDLDNEQRKAFGQAVNLAKTTIETLLEQRRTHLRINARNTRIDSVHRDLSLPGRSPQPGHRHPISLVEDAIVDVMIDLGYSVATGPQIETDFHNFEALNFPPDHPARDMQDTFFLADGRLLRTHTSPVQVRTMLANKPPIRICAPGPVYRADTADMTHSPNFRQVEGLYIDKGVTLAHLKGTLQEFASRLFGKQLNVRLRPSFFPFTEPSVEADIECPFCTSGCRVCKGSTWIEILGAGMVDPNVLLACGVDPEEWQGFAFGIGVERVAMLLYGVDDMRAFYDNDMRFLAQFPS